MALMLLITLTWIGVCLHVYYDTAHEVEEIYDATLAQSARILLGLLKHEAAEDKQHLIGEIPMHGKEEHPYETKIAMLGRYVNGNEAFRTFGAPDFPDASADGFHTLYLNGHNWRIFSLVDSDSGVHVRTGQKLEIREALVDHILGKGLAGLIIGLPVFGLFIWWAVGRGLLPLKQLSTEVEEMEPEFLRPIAEKSVPKEVHILVSSLNGLFERLDKALEKERRFTADAAHELRTPLAALKIQAQVAQRATNEKQKNRALANIIDGVARTTRLVEQLLTLARVDVMQAQGTLNTKVDLYPIAKETLAAVASDAVARNIEVSLDAGTPPYPVLGDGTMLGVMLRNLIGNGLKYSPDGGHLKVKLNHTESAVEVAITDSGPGIPEDEIADLFERFRRGSNAAVSGTGLGLSIAKRVCDTHKAAIYMSRDDAGSGFTVHVRLLA